MIFTEDNTSYSLKSESIKSPEEISSGLWLVMAGIDGIPPHIALINEGEYYSVSTKRVEVGVPIQNFLKAISKRSVPTLFISIKSHVSKVLPNGEDLGGAFNSYSTLGNGEHSCLWPIRDFFAQTFSEKYSKAEFVFELLAMAQNDNLILECKSLFVDASPQIGTVSLPKYTKEQIRERINSILNING